MVKLGTLLILGLASIGVLIIFLYIKLFNKKHTKAELKGIEGEEKINQILKQQKGVRYFTDILLKIGPHSTQIDHLVIFPDKTILVLETKNKDGKIIGNEGDKRWKQFIGNKKYSFYSPMLQNLGHIRFLNRFCEKKRLKGYKFISLIVFASDNCDIKDTPLNTIHYNDLPKYLKIFRIKKFLNRSSAFTREIARNDLSKNRREVKKHIQFAKRMAANKNSYK